LYVVHQVRLVDGPNPHSGRVEVYTNSTGGLDNAQWGTVCDANWNFLNARVICHQLGYPDAVAAPLAAHYGPGTGPIWLNNIECIGTEPDLFTCKNDGIGSHSCGHHEDASAECIGMHLCQHCTIIIATHACTVATIVTYVTPECLTD